MKFNALSPQLRKLWAFCFSIDMFNRTVKRFRSFTFFTIINVYLVIVAGGVVRCTGSGMGCPDWPKCFGKWIPPTTIEELPANYVELYSKGGHLTVEFNVFKTWTEYINRLLGAFVGIFIFGTPYFSLIYWNTKRQVFYFSLLAFILVGFQGWLGAKVVASNLAPFMVSIHMLVALIIVIILIFVYAIADEKRFAINRINSLLIVCGILSLVQILIGSQVRQSVDVVAKSFNYLSRELWVEQLGGIFITHRIFAYIVIIVNSYLVYKLHKSNHILFRNLILAILFSEICTGFVLTYFEIPSYIQPIHLTMATILFGIQFYLLAANNPKSV